MQRKLLIVVLALACYPALASVDARPYRIATVAWIGWSPLHVAKVNNFWSDLGVEVEVVDYDDPIIVLEAARSGKIDLAMGMVGSLVGLYMRGEAVVAIAETNWSHGGDKIIVRAGHSIQDFKGHPLGLFLDLPSCLYFLGRYLETQNMVLANFRIVELHADDLTAQFEAGRIPVILNYEPWASTSIGAGTGNILATSADFAGCIPECLWGYRRHVEQIPSEDIKRILSGWLRAVQWIQQAQNRTAYFEILNRITFQNFADYTSSQLKTMQAHVKIHLPEELERRNRRGGGLMQYLNDLRDFLDKNGLLQKDFTPDDLFDNRWIMNVLKSEERIVRNE